MILYQNIRRTYRVGVGGRLIDRLAESSSVGENNEEGKKKGVKKLHGGK